MLDLSGLLGERVVNASVKDSGRVVGWDGAGPNHSSPTPYEGVHLVVVTKSGEVEFWSLLECRLQGGEPRPRDVVDRAP